MKRLHAVVADARRRILDVLPEADVRLSGGALIEGDSAVDVDLVVLVEDVVGCGTRLRAAGLAPLFEEDWRDDWVAFRADRSPQVDVVVTRVGTKGDAHHRRAWDALLNDPALLAEYRALKTDRAGYEARKAAFFERVVASLPPPA